MEAKWKNAVPCYSDNSLAGEQYVSLLAYWQ